MIVNIQQIGYNKMIHDSIPNGKKYAMSIDSRNDSFQIKEIRIGITIYGNKYKNLPIFFIFFIWQPPFLDFILP